MSAGFAALLQQMAEMSAKATTKTVGVVGDDLAVSCNQLIGGQPERKLPMIYKVVKGSLKNKAVMIPCALALSFTLPGLIVPLLTIGGACLCFDSVDKLIHKKLKAPSGQVSEAYANDHAAWERRHVKRALTTDLLLSAEITTVALFTVAAMPFAVQLAALAAAGLAMTAGVYGVVAGILKLDDIGAKLAAAPGTNPAAKAARAAGRLLVKGAPKIIKAIGVAGTVAMFTVGGGMLLHGTPGAAALMAPALAAVSSSALVQGVVSVAAQTAVGIVAGFAALPVGRIVWPPLMKALQSVKKLKEKIRPSAPEPDDGEDEAPAPTLAPTPEAAKSALKNLPDIKAGLNAALSPVVVSSPPVIVSAPLPELKAPPAAKAPKP